MSRSLPEWIGTTDETAIPPRVKRRVRQRDGNCCQACTRPLHNEPAECDHIRALINGGSNRELNLQTLCRGCHKNKTRSDVAEKSLSYRRQIKRLGIKRTRRPFPGGRDTPFKRKVDGTVVRRDEEAAG